mgnify:CR=1 FL=1
MCVDPDFIFFPGVSCRSSSRGGGLGVVWAPVEDPSKIRQFSKSASEAWKPITSPEDIGVVGDDPPHILCNVAQRWRSRLGVLGHHLERVAVIVVVAGCGRWRANASLVELVVGVTRSRVGMACGGRRAPLSVSFLLINWQPQKLAPRMQCWSCTLSLELLASNLSPRRRWRCSLLAIYRGTLCRR